MEYDRQDILDKAAMAYDHAEATIRAMDSVFQNVTGSDYNAELTLAQFDMILQGVLLSVAMADGVFEPVEQDFIRQFAMHGDLLEYIRNDSNGEVDLTWDAIAGLPEDVTEGLVAVLPRVLDDQCESFIYPLAAVDFTYSQVGNVITTPGDFLKSIEADMIRIAGLLAFVDSEDTDEDIFSTTPRMRTSSRLQKSMHLRQSASETSCGVVTTMAALSPWIIWQAESDSSPVPGGKSRIR